MNDAPAPLEKLPPVPVHAARQGLTLFFVYLAAFGAFLLLHVLAPDALGATEVPLGADRVLTLWGANVAIVSGIGLILLAMLFCMMYLRAAQSAD